MNFKVTCPACKSNDEKQVINQYDYVQASKYFCPESRNKNRNLRFAEAIRRLWNQDIGYFLRCGVCTFGFGYPFVGGDEEFYNIVHEQAGYPKNRWEYDNTIDVFFREKPVLKILDIGSGTGNFLDKIICPLKFAMEGSESNRKILKKKGFEVYSDHNALMEQNMESFNYITMFQVLEHIADFESVLYTANRLLSINSYLIISVPDCDAMILQEKLTGYPDIFPNHINKWTPQSLQLVLARFGFKREIVIDEPLSIRKFFDSIHLKISHKATINGTFAASIYKIKNKSIRILLLLFYALIELPSSMPHYKKLSRGGSFLLKALKVHKLEKFPN